MSVVQYILAFAVIAVSVAIVIIVIMQESKSQGLSGAIAGGAESFFGKNKGRTMEAKLVKITKVLATLFFVLALIASLLVLFTNSL